MSQVNADTIRKSDGSLGTDIRIKNTSVYESEGGTSVTQNLVQGLCKAFINFNGAATGLTSRDSFNISGTTDLGVGNYQAAVTNGFASGSNWVTTGHAGNNSATNAGNAFSSSNPHSSTSGHLETMNDEANNSDRGYIGMVYHGDLA